MKIIIYKLWCSFFFIIAWNSLVAQSISGIDKVCIGNQAATYNFSDNTCASVSDINWSFDYNGSVSVLSSVGQSALLIWSAVANGPDNATLKVTYDCTDGDGNVVEKSLEYEITIELINQPIIASPSAVNLVCNELDQFVITLNSQPGSATVSVSHPDCFTYSQSGLAFTFSPDAAASGDICFTITQPFCNLQATQCITVSRACQDDLTFTSQAPIQFAYNSVDNYITASDVSTAAFPSSEFKAGKAIDLKAGFKAKAAFLAHIGPCSCLPEGTEGCFYGKSARPTRGDGRTVEEPSGNNGRALRSGGQNTGEESAPIHSFESADKLLIYPNPSQGRFSIKFPVQEETATIQVFDVMGRLMMSRITDNSTETIDASEFQEGIYIVVVSTQNTTFKDKVIISK